MSPAATARAEQGESRGLAMSPAATARAEQGESRGLAGFHSSVESGLPGAVLSTINSYLLVAPQPVPPRKIVKVLAIHLRFASGCADVAGMTR
jgi:hypothetical protein